MHNPLGKNTPYKDTFDPSLLFSIPRTEGRKRFGLGNELPFEGVDIWTCYELSWLDQNRIPKVGIVRIEYPADSLNIIESKSLKLFLGSFNNYCVESVEQVRELIQRELLERLETDRCSVSIFEPDEWEKFSTHVPVGKCIDDTKPSSEFPSLIADTKIGSEIIHSHLLRSLCPVTAQPDWGTLVVSYRGALVNYSSLIQYLIAQRNYQGFHEECCEKLFLALEKACHPEAMSVGCFYTRRGGIDINPIRWIRGTKQEVQYERLYRQ